MASDIESTNIDDVNVEEELANFLLDILRKTDDLWGSDCRNVNSILSLTTVVDQAVGFLRAAAEVVDADQDQWVSLAGVFSELLPCLNKRQRDLLVRPTTTRPSTYNT